ncbi:A24 family peptidase C-terminal domain-containing protein [Methanobacterium aggregans]|uniref:A24 family peptidase C-terminal domain-containing protein n=1 Tax=Methanobacterium aggregans TaxID=1615586 RepID=UPI001AE378BA|nr:A24 family peptidase C-terminal domain-containing protein [Methanobacterium aggregans]MBP2045235.1 preflagellin peptidase FlaK [Methanobacterium aggregans]
MIINIPFICAVIAILACVYASYSDIKDGVIKNKLTFPLIGIGIVLNGIYAFMTSNPMFLILCVICTAVIFALGYLFWKFGAWAGGDVKLFTALAALLPFPAVLLNYNVGSWSFPVFAVYPFALTIIINSILSILPFLLIFVFYIAVKKKPYLLDELLAPIKEDYTKNILLALVITAAAAIILEIRQFIDYPLIISIILTIVLILAISKLPDKLKAVVVTVTVAFALYSRFEITLISIGFLLVSITFINIIKKILTSVSKEALQDDYKISELQDGMIPAYNMYELDGEIQIDDKGFFTKFKEAIKTGDVSKLSGPRGKLVVGSMAAGLQDKDIEHLKNIFKEGKIENNLRIKRGVPFAPSILIGLLISLFIGDLAFIIEKILYTII